MSSPVDVADDHEPIIMRSCSVRRPLAGDAPQLLLAGRADHPRVAAVHQAPGLRPVHLGRQRLDVQQGVRDVDRDVVGGPVQAADRVHRVDQARAGAQGPPHLVHRQHQLERSISPMLRALSIEL